MNNQEKIQEASTFSPPVSPCPEETTVLATAAVLPPPRARRSQGQKWAGGQGTQEMGSLLRTQEKTVHSQAHFRTAGAPRSRPGSAYHQQVPPAGAPLPSRARLSRAWVAQNTCSRFPGQKHIHAGGGSSASLQWRDKSSKASLAPQFCP